MWPVVTKNGGITRLHQVVCVVWRTSSKVLWESPTNSGITGTPSSFMVDGRQYIAVMSGISKGKVYGFALP